jgi:beta-glucosidase
MSPTRFPAGFLWGAATSAYQIEGSPLADGAGESIWHRFSHTPGATRDGDTGDVACDHYRRYAEDVRLMREIGLRAYRMSLAWARLLPRGRGPVNRKGVDFYARLIDLLLESGIQPMVTLYHWDLPSALHERGGWTHPDSPQWFADYAALAFKHYGDRVPLWCTINEPWMVSDGGYVRGFLAPGRRSLAEGAAVSIHLQRAHAQAVRVYRDMAKGRIGLVVNLEPKHPDSDAAEDVSAARRADAYMNRQYLDPVLLGVEAEEVAEMFAGAWPRRSPAELAAVREPGDFLGVNYYSRGVTRDDPDAPPPRARSVPPPEAELSEMGWEVHPAGLEETLLWVRERYGALPLFVTENGAAFADPGPGENGLVEDPRRVDYLRRHLLAAREAIELGVDLRGYFVWSLLDNFEWQQGYSKRFGLVRVDFRTQRRTLKRSALFYRDVIRTHGLEPEARAAEV